MELSELDGSDSIGERGLDLTASYAPGEQLGLVSLLSPKPSLGAGEVTLSVRSPALSRPYTGAERPELISELGDTSGWRVLGP